MEVWKDDLGGGWSEIKVVQWLDPLLLHAMCYCTQSLLKAVVVGGLWEQGE